jgi:hypothetical protein
MKIAEYHRHPAWSPSALKCAITGTMRAFDHRYGPNAAPFVPTDDMNKGSLVDCLVTPPFHYDEMFAAYGIIARNTNDGKANYNEAVEKGLIPITYDTAAQAVDIKASLEADPEVGRILAAMDFGTSQAPYFWTDAAGRPCRMLPDVITMDGGLYDLKKTRSAKPKKFYKQAMDLAYDLQMAHLALGFEDLYGHPPEEVGIIAFEWEPPFDRSLLIFNADDIALGLEKREEAFRRIAECQASGIWPSHGRQPFRPERASVAPLTIDPNSIDLF